MKKILFAGLMVLTGCRADVMSPEWDLGTPSSVLLVNSTSSPITTGLFTVDLQLTPNAAYSLQLTHINGDILNNYGFTTKSAQMSITLDYTKVPNGAYDLVLMDNTGRLQKIAVIIQR